MTEIVLPEATLSQLVSAGKPVAIVDSSGRAVGTFVPRAMNLDVFYRGVKSPLSAEERQRLIEEEGPTARPLSEFWERMQAKYPDAYEPGFWDEMKKKS